VDTVEGAVAALGSAPRRVFVALGRNELQPFAAAPQHHYLLRSVDLVDPPLAVSHATYITARGPFSEADDRALLERHDIELVVAKNSGGPSTYGKIAAARALGLPVIMLKRPALPEVESA
jgi:precorrin-6A/cobalt-precorrin-6A reductase